MFYTVFILISVGTDFGMKTLLDAFVQYSLTKQTQSGKKTISNLKTVFRQYLLPKLYPGEIERSNLKGAALDLVLEQIAVTTLIEAQPLVIFQALTEEAIAAGQIKAQVVRTTYRPALTGFLKWIEAQQLPVVEQKQEERRYAPRMVARVSYAESRRGNKNWGQDPYGLPEEMLTPSLIQQMQSLKTFWMGKEVPERLDKPIRAVTYDDTVKRVVLLFLGWLRYVQNWSLEQLSIDLILSNGQMPPVENLQLVKRFVAWGINEREAGYGWAMMIMKGALSVAKYKHAPVSKRPNYRDIEVIEQIRLQLNRYEKQYKATSVLSATEKADKEMTFDQTVEVVKYLRDCCAPKRNNHCARKEIAIMRSWQRYLLVAILTYCPLRQREIREFCLGRTLFREQGYRVILQPEDNKTGDHRDFCLVDMLPPEVITDFDRWLDEWRPWFLEQLREEAKDENTWFSSLGYDQKHLERQFQDLWLEAGTEDFKQNWTVSQQKKHFRKVKKVKRILDSWQRVQNDLQQNYVFLILGATSGKESKGKPFERESFRDLVVTAVHNATSILAESEHPLFVGVDPKRTNPHFFRNIGTTHQRRNGDPAKRAAFHKVIGNSVAEGDRTYNEMLPSEKTKPAANWWKSGGNSQQNLDQIRALLSELTLEERAKLKPFL